jgi:hypothetical protein
LRGFLVIFGTVALMAFIAWLLMGAMSDRRDERIRAKGYPVTAAELEEWLPSPPLGQNAARYYVEAAKLIDATSFAQEHLLPGFGSDDAMPDLGEPIGASTRTAIADFIAHEADAFKLIDEGAEYPESNYGMPIMPTAGVTPHLSQVRAVAHAQRLRVLHAMAEDDADLAIDEFSKMVAIARSMGQEPLMISGMVYTALVGLAVDTAEQLVNSGLLQDDDLRALDEQLALLLDDQGLVPAFLGERCFNVSADGSITTVPIVGDWYEADVLGVLDGFIELAEEGLPARLDAYRSWSGRSYSYIRPLSSLVGPGFARAAQSYYEVRARILAARASIAIERAREDGAAPKDFMSLPDSVRENWPVDPFSGEPMIYLRVDHGYVVYSIGGDLKDGGGISRAELREQSKRQESGGPSSMTGRAIGDAVFRILK